MEEVELWLFVYCSCVVAVAVASGRGHGREKQSRDEVFPAALSKKSEAATAGLKAIEESRINQSRQAANPSTCNATGRLYCTAARSTVQVLHCTKPLQTGRSDDCFE